MTRLLVTGDSHAHAVRWGLLARQKAGDAPDFVRAKALGTGRHMREPFFVRVGDTIRFTIDEYKRSIEAIWAADDRVYAFSMGMHTPSMFNHAMWQTKVPWRVCEGLTPLSDAVVAEISLATWPYVLSFYETCLALRVRFFVIPCPPPRRSHPCIARGVKPRTVIEVDRLFRQTMAAWFSERQISLLPLPEGLTDEDGFLRSDFEASYPGDHHHGNVIYGARMLDVIQREFTNYQLSAAD